MSKTLNTQTKHMIIASILILNPLQIQGRCLNEVFLLENPHYQPTKGELKIRNPAYHWKKKIEHFKVANEIYEKVDENEYQYMFHAYHPRFGLEIYRICPKKSNSNQNNDVLEVKPSSKIEYHLDRGHRMKANDLLVLDSYLWNNKFHLMGNREMLVKIYIKEQKQIQKKEFEKNYPLIASLIICILELFYTLCYIGLTAPIFYLIYYVIDNL